MASRATHVRSRSRLLSTNQPTTNLPPLPLPMPARVVEPNHDLVLAQLPLAIPKIFDQVQNSIANHQKNFVALYKIHTEAAQVTETVKNGKAVRLTGERKFEDEFQKMLLCVLAQKKSAAQAERVIKFVAGYTRFVNEKGAYFPGHAGGWTLKGCRMEQPLRRKQRVKMKMTTKRWRRALRNIYSNSY